MHAAGFASIPTSQHARDGLKLRDAYVTAVVRCAPPENKPTTREMRQCHAYLEAEVASLSQIRVVVALGKIAFDAYWRLIAEHDVAPRPRPGFAHGYVFRADGVPALITSYHPSQQNTNTGKLTQPMLADVLSRAKRNSPPRRPARASRAAARLVDVRTQPQKGFRRFQYRLGECRVRMDTMGQVWDGRPHLNRDDSLRDKLTCTGPTIRHPGCFRTPCRRATWSFRPFD